MRSAALTFALLVVLAGFTPAAAAEFPTFDDGEPADAAGDVPEQPAVSALPPSALSPRTDIVIQLQRDADARWEVSYRYSLETANQTRAFRQIGTEFENGSNVGPDAALFEEAASRAADATNRGMRIENVSHDYAVVNGTGTLTLSFTWTNFAEQVEPGSLRLEDVFRSPGNETWLASLEPSQELRIRTPPGYNVARNPGFRRHDDTIVITSATLRSRRPVIEYGRVRDTATVTTTPTAPNAEDFSAIGMVALAAVIVALLIGWRRQQSSPTAAADERVGAATGGESDGGEEMEPAVAEVGGTAEPDPAPTAEPDPAETIGEPDDVDPSLLSDEERVERLLERNGGRMKQANIVRETGWSDAKVSQLLSSMADEGRVDKLRLGRENLISLPDEGED